MLEESRPCPSRRLEGITATGLNQIRERAVCLLLVLPEAPLGFPRFKTVVVKPNRQPVIRANQGLMQWSEAFPSPVRTRIIARASTTLEPCDAVALRCQRVSAVGWDKA